MPFSIALAVLLAPAIGALEHPVVKRQVSELRESYDFVIAGAGTSGLTVADRLTEAFPDSELIFSMLRCSFTPSIPG